MSFPSGWVAVATTQEELQKLEELPLRAVPCVGVELRFDLWPTGLPAHVTPLLPVARPTIVTLRRSPAITEPRRRDFLREALSMAPAVGGPAGQDGHQLWIDLDLDDPTDRSVLEAQPERSERWCRIIGSSHKVATVDDDAVHATIAEMIGLGCDAAKVVLAEGGVAALRQALRIGADYRSAPYSVSVTAGGLEGLSSRVLTVQRHLGWSYARLPGSPGSAAGQPSLNTLGEWWGSRGDVLYGVVGGGVADSISPPFHNHVLSTHLDVIDEAATFLSFPLEGNPDALLEESPELVLAGLAVTTPHKEWARSVAEPASPADAPYRSWNSLRRDGDGWVGTNTDGLAAVELLTSAGLRSGETVAILGAGGAALGIAQALRQRGFGVLFVARKSAARAHALAAVSGARAHATVASETGASETGASDNGAAVAVAWINATGHPNPEPLIGVGVQPPRIALELSYREFAESASWLAGFESHGCRVIDGVEFFAAQARHQVRWLYGVELSMSEAGALARRCADLL